MPFPSYWTHYVELQQEAGTKKNPQKGPCWNSSNMSWTWQSMNFLHEMLIIGSVKNTKSWLSPKKCLHVLPEMCTLNLIPQREKNILFGHIINYTVLQKLIYISCHTIFCYITVPSIFKPLRKYLLMTLKEWINYWKYERLHVWFSFSSAVISSSKSEVYINSYFFSLCLLFL